MSAGTLRFWISLAILPNPGLIVTPETVGTEANPTWSWDPPNDGADTVLLDDSLYTFDYSSSVGAGVSRAARWSVDGQRITFQATEIATGLYGVYVADTVDGDSDGQVDGLANIFLAVENGFLVNWGGSDRFSFYLENHPTLPDGIYLYDLALPTSSNPTLLVPQPLPQPPPDPPLNIEKHNALSSDGSTLAFAVQVDFNSGGAPIRNELMTMDVTTGVMTQITNLSRAKNANNLRPGDFSPDNSEILYQAADEPGPATLFGFDLYRITVAGSTKTKRLTRRSGGIEDQSYAPTWRKKPVGGGGNPPAAPSNLQAGATSSSQIDLSWNDNSSDEDGFEIERSLDQSNWSQIVTTGANVTSHSDTGLSASTTYYYRARAFNGAGDSGYSNTAPATTEAGGGGSGLATSDIAVAGTVSGSYADTHAADGTLQTIQERESGGKPANRYSYLEHRWTFDVASASTSFWIQAWHNDVDEGDDFLFEYSTDGNNYVGMITITETLDPGSPVEVPLGTSLGGTVYVRVTDLDQTQGNRDKDTVSIDQMFFQ